MARIFAYLNHIYIARYARKAALWAVVGLVVGLFGCGGSSTEENGSSNLSEAADELRFALDDVATLSSFTLVLEANNGSRFIYRRGNSSESTSYESASSSKMVTAGVILWLVEQGYLALNDNPQDYLSFWPDTGNLADIELNHLLSFTSGLTDAPLCVNFGSFEFEHCVESILESNRSIAEPGTTFYYASTHMQVAGLMAIKATGLSSWQDVFALFQSRTGLFENAAYDLPSAQNPRLAGGMHWQAEEYIHFLESIYRQELLAQDTVMLMSSNQISNADIVYSPTESGFNSVDWRYGYGVWIECDSVPFDCADMQRISSPGAYGAYPFIDFSEQYYGIVALQEPLGSGDTGYLLWESVRTEIEHWAQSNL